MQVNGSAQRAMIMIQMAFGRAVDGGLILAYSHSHAHIRRWGLLGFNGGRSAQMLAVVACYLPFAMRRMGNPGGIAGCLVPSSFLYRSAGIPATCSVI